MTAAEMLWHETMARSREIDPLIREALRPVFERLKADVSEPGIAAAFALAMICRALRAMEVPPGHDLAILRQALCQAALNEVAARPEHP